MSILIKDMEMPTEGYIDVRIKCNCTASFAIADNPYFKAVEAVPVPPHGRLINADALFKEMERKGWFDNADRDKAEDLVLDAPTIIPAEDGE